jgi:hypothetical protein
MKLYFAAAENSNYAEILKGTTDKILESAFYLKYKEKPNRFGFKDVLLDSGGFTALVKNYNLPLKDYIDYLNKYEVKLAFALDVRDQDITIQNTYDLKKYTNTKIIPVYHDHDYFSSKRDIIEKYCADFDFVSIAGLTRKNYPQEEREKFGNYVFSRTTNKIKVHGLAVTSKRWLYKYPFYSVDSTTWLNIVKYGEARCFKEERLFNSVAAKTRNGKHFLKNEIKNFLLLEKEITNYWRIRGIEWND